MLLNSGIEAVKPTLFILAILFAHTSILNPWVLTPLTPLYRLLTIVLSFFRLGKFFYFVDADVLSADLYLRDAVYEFDAFY